MAERRPAYREPAPLALDDLYLAVIGLRAEVEAYRRAATRALLLAAFAVALWAGHWIFG